MVHEGGVCRVLVTRGAVLESIHEVSVAVADGAGRLRAYAGEPARRLFARSAIKALQALPLLEDGVADALGVTDEELALCCASHSGEARHVELAATLLARIGAAEDALACGPHWPYHDGSARALRTAGLQPSRLHNNCSGKHAGMLALAHHHGWPLTGYHLPEHPVQQRMLREVARWSGLASDEIDVAVDGCGVATFSLPLASLASAFGRLAAEARTGGSAAARIVEIALQHPHLVGGTDRLCTALMQAAAGRIFAKVGAEGVYCAAVPGAELGIALKVHDGATRASEPALLAVLHALGLLTEAEQPALSRWVYPELRNTRGEVVGGLRCEVELASVS